MDLVVGLDSSTTTAVPFEAARVLCAAHAIWERMGAVRFKIYRGGGYEASVAALRVVIGEKDFESAWPSAALSTYEAIACAQRGRGERKRPVSGWESLTPAERDAMRLAEGLGKNDIATRLFRLTAHRANPPHLHLHQIRPHLPRTTFARSSPPRLTHHIGR